MAIIPEQDREFLKQKFRDEMDGEVTILTYTKRPEGESSEGFECEFCAETEELMNEVAGLSDKINVEVREYSPDVDIDKLPAIVIAKDGTSGVRYFGIPGGFEFSSFVEDLVDVSRNSTDLSDQTKKKVRSIDKAVHIQVFVTPTCPYCPSAVRIAHQMAVENPGHIKADAVEAAEFPYLVERYGIDAVPTVVINDKVQFEGALPDEDFADQVNQALGA
ncbi:MAG: protein disulfide oxidoreductase [Armatimonadota bacterium]